MPLLCIDDGYDPSALPPVRHRPVLWIGVGDLGRVLAQGHLDLASTETPGLRAVCLTRSHRVAMLFADDRSHQGQGGVLALDATRLRHRHRVVPHRDRILTTKARAEGYDEREERVYGHVPLDGLLLGVWRSAQSVRFESCLTALAPHEDPWALPDVDWDDAFSESHCQDTEDDGRQVFAPFLDVAA